MRRRGGWGVQLRLTVLAVLVVGLGLVLGGAVVAVLVRDDLTGDAEEQALSRAESAVPLVEAGLPAALPDLVQVVDRDGAVLASNEALGGTRLLALWPDADVVTGTSRLPDGERCTVAGVRGTLAGRPVAVYAAASLDHVEDGVTATVHAMAVIVPVLVVAVTLVSWLLVGRALRPIGAIRRQVSEITGSRLDRRVPEPPTDDEVGRLARTMNAMLARMQADHDRQQRFAADAAHELRSPLAAIRAQLEIGLTHPDRTDWVRVAQDLHREGARLSGLTDELLELARSDDAPDPTGWVDLDEVVLAEIETIRSRGTVEVLLSPFSAVRLHGNAGGLRRVVRNLLDNAERHARGTVTVGLWLGEDGFAELVVSDDGPGVPGADHDRVFDRFFRVQPARARKDGGAGLGLAIVRDVVERHGGTVWLANPSSGASFHVRLPAGSV
ncbi:HAMP domain-containing sensor histidine kinase [Actinosynnema sp. NPDC047251]|uniref:histidine kinase n=1 Tax=Saccharothrix espanaensis (strain ATCC 51144 / DSM 44229 / JCM 9112 / NBRC 15066 / NRRL 15764) TaxID=1179773 RepID=K0JXL9_SACES|nr:HAMP domain-containing sensor histidine kinase [Saccharothrix espanaensis]CCH32620.1 Two-component system, sensor histidine kinase [Saccharothrix espanaensis DSM 44229]